MRPSMRSSERRGELTGINGSESPVHTKLHDSLKVPVARHQSEVIQRKRCNPCQSE
jgi:hypothetical protein